MNETKLTQFFETLHAQTPKSDYLTIYAQNIHFKDPFHEIEGVDALYNIFAQMYMRLDNPRFILKEYIEHERVAYIKWEFIFTFKGEKREQSFEGVSRLEIDNEGRISRHIDYWDASENIYEKVPILGWVLRAIKHKIAKGQ